MIQALMSKLPLGGGNADVQHDSDTMDAKKLAFDLDVWPHRSVSPRRSINFFWELFKVRDNLMRRKCFCLASTQPDSSVILLVFFKTIGIEETIQVTLSGALAHHSEPRVNERICRDLATLEQLNDHETAQKLNLRLQCIELLYFNAQRSILPQMLNCDRPPQAVPPPTIEDICILRHREITTKAVLAILISTLKWFKASPVG
ncbi:hypothetical protein PSHT_14517 [Puccinia striiformis]|uniref:Far11/STRP C-terminal domain-containing protein n=1 Tax=Puccinia striiformis TaxID=27350 RepID=A0A2S4UJR0_9BASI|nr:hypothetical protein PSHT_14517 [Puccinia striiformis]